MTASEKLNKILFYLNINAKVLSENLGYKRPQVMYDIQTGKTKNLSSEFINKLTSVYPVFNRLWLLTDEGEMLNDTEDICKSAFPHSQIPEVTESTYVLLLPTSAQGGSLNDFVVSIKGQDCEKVVSPIKDVDLAVQVSGDSMAPEYPNGSRVFIKKINEQAFIEWGKAYVLDTCNGTVIKLLVPSDKEGYVRCLSINPDPIYAPFDVAMKDIFGVYKVLLSMSIK